MDDLFIKFLEAADYQIKESDDFAYPMYPNARYMCASTDEGFGALGIHFNGETREVYEIIANTEGKWPGDHVAYRWMHPDYKMAARTFYAKSSDPDAFCDGAPYIDLCTPEDCLDKGKSLLAGDTEYDRRIVMSFDMEEEEIALIHEACNRLGMTIDEFVEEALLKAIGETDPAMEVHLRNQGLGNTTAE